MRIPLRQMIDLGRYMSRKKRAGEKYYPIVLMLEPLHACNLACVGCGRIVEYKDTIRDQMPLEEALNAADEADAPGHSRSLPPSRSPAGRRTSTAGVTAAVPNRARTE